MKTIKFPFNRTALASALLAASVAPQVTAQTDPKLMLEEVIVTAQKRTESVQDIAATVNVVTGDTMDEFATFTFADVEQLTAGVSLNVKNARNATISMRGVSTDPESGAPAAVDVYWNEMSVRPDIAFNQMYDLERLEILRGPQGTLQGRTSPGGAINMITRKPNMEEMEGFVQGTASDDDGFNGQVAINVPIIESKLAVRFAGVYDENNASNVENPVTGDDAHSETKSTRLSIGWDPIDTVSSVFTWQYLDRNVDDPKNVSGTDSLNQRPTLGDTSQTALADMTNFGDQDFDLYNYRISWDVVGHDVTAVAGYVDATKKAQTQTDRANYITNPQQLTHQDSETKTDAKTIEIRMASQDRDFWDYMFGVYYLNQETDTNFLANSTLADTTPVVGGVSFETESILPVNNKETGVFTFNKFYLSDISQLEVGLRWSNYDRHRRADVFYTGASYSPNLPLETADILFGTRFPIEAITGDDVDPEDDAITGSLTYRYDWTDEISVYGSYNRGYRPGGISIIPSPNILEITDPVERADLLLYDEEKSNAFEVGFKSTLLDGRATLNGALYYQQFDGYMGFVREVEVLNAAGAPLDLPGGIVYNGDANIWGIEFEGQVRLTEYWLAGGALSFNKGEWDNAMMPCNEREGDEQVGSCDIDGEDVGGEPEFTLTLNSEYSIPIESMEWYVRGLYKYTDERNNIDASAGIGAVEDTFDSYNNINLYTGIRNADFTWDVNIWVKNLLDEDALTFQTSPDQYDTRLSGGSYTETNILKERTIGLTARYNF